MLFAGAVALAFIIGSMSEGISSVRSGRLARQEIKKERVYDNQEDLLLGGGNDHGIGIGCVRADEDC
jgi:hypothetical protein